MLYGFGQMLPAAVTVGWLVTAWRLADWRNWRPYYPTILFVICVDFFVSILTYDHTLWRFEPSAVSPNHTTTDFAIAYTNFPPMMLLFLSRYPAGARLFRQIAYAGLWSAGCSLLEMIFFQMGLVRYDNGWTMWWSVLFWFLMFPIVRLHSLQPLWAWLVVFALAICGITHFHIPVAHLR